MFFACLDIPNNHHSACMKKYSLDLLKSLWIQILGDRWWTKWRKIWKPMISCERIGSRRATCWAWSRARGIYCVAAFFWNGGIPIAGWFTMENPTRIDDLGYPYFRKAPEKVFPKNHFWDPQVTMDYNTTMAELGWLGGYHPFWETYMYSSYK